jgi:beta-xylosidase
MKLRVSTLIAATALACVGSCSIAAAQSPAPPQKQPTKLPATCYVFSYFVGNGEDGLHLAWSRDGLKWRALNGGQSLLTPTVGKSKLMRDPCITRGPDGLFHMVWTDSWYGTTIGYASSPDLVHWSQQKSLSVMKDEPTVANCWAPEILYDAAAKYFRIFWSSTIPGRFPATEFEGKNDNNHRIYETTTRDFKTFSPTKLFFEPGFNVIDATLLNSGGKSYLFFKDETKFPQPAKNLRVALAPSLGGPYTVQPEPVTKQGQWVEGPTLLKVGRETYLYADAHTEGRYIALRSRDLRRWENVTSQLEMPRGIRHGTALAVPASVVAALLKRDEP